MLSIEQDQPIFISSIKPFSNNKQLVTLVNATDTSALPHTHLYVYQGEDKYPILLVTGNAFFTAIGLSEGRYIYLAGEHGHIITNYPHFDFPLPSREDLSSYEPEGQSKFVFGKIAKTNIVLSIGHNCENRVTFCCKDGAVLTYLDGRLEQEVMISIDPLTYCVDDQDNIYVGTEEGKVWLLTSGEPRQLTMESTGLPRAIIKGMCISPEGDLYIVSYNGFIAKRTVDGVFTILKSPCKRYSGIAFANGIMYVSTDEELCSVVEYDGEVTLTQLRDSFIPKSMISYDNELYITSGTPMKSPYFVKAKPSNTINELSSCRALYINYKIDNT
jgi:hypothetical protein